MSKRTYLVLCEERCCACGGSGEEGEKGTCLTCKGEGFTQYPVNMKKAFIDLLLSGALDE